MTADTRSDSSDTGGDTAMPTVSDTNADSAVGTTGPGESTGMDPDSGSDSGSSGTDGGDPGPMVDTTDPQLYEFMFNAGDADPEATIRLQTQLGYLDTTVPNRGRLVVYLHGAGNPATCGSVEHGSMLAGLGFHVISPCYESGYSVASCEDDLGGCRLEAFEGVDHHPFLEIGPPDSIEVRVVRALEYLQQMHPGGDWQYFIDGDRPRWDRMIVSGISHGASTSGVIGMNRIVDRVVMLSGPFDNGQAWLQGEPMTPVERFWGFSHTGDGQHEGHLAAFEALGLPGELTTVDGAMPPFDQSHRLVTSVEVANGHGSTQASSSSPQMDDAWVFRPVWETMYFGD